MKSVLDPKPKETSSIAIYVLIALLLIVFLWVSYTHWSLDKRTRSAVDETNQTVEPDPFHEYYESCFSEALLVLRFSQSYLTSVGPSPNILHMVHFNSSEEAIEFLKNINLFKESDTLERAILSGYAIPELFNYTSQRVIPHNDLALMVTQQAILVDNDIGVLNPEVFTCINGNLSRSSQIVINIRKSYTPMA